MFVATFFRSAYFVQLSKCNNMTKLPYALIYARLILGVLIVLLGELNISNYPIIAVSLLTLGVFTDIFDGIIARKLGDSTSKLRRLDSTVDQVFFVLVVVATYRQCPAFFAGNVVKLLVLIGTEALAYLVSFAKFKKEIATHSIGAKIWTLVLFATLVQIMLHCDSGILFEVCFWLGIITRVEIILILLILRKWTNDVPTVYHSIRLRQGKEIRRNRLFNG